LHVLVFWEIDQSNGLFYHQRYKNKRCRQNIEYFVYLVSGFTFFCIWWFFCSTREFTTIRRRIWRGVCLGTRSNCKAGRTHGYWKR